MEATVKILLLDPFHGGSHAQFADTLVNGVQANWTTVTMPGRHWKWRMRGSAAWFATHHAQALAGSYDALVTTSMLPLAELLGFCPDLAAIPSVLYFHENQLAYPVRPEFSGERDHHYGFTQFMSALAATHCVFNSAHNRDSFLGEVGKLLAKMPDGVDAGWVPGIESRSRVLGVPLDLPDHQRFEDGADRHLGPIICWNHRWEYDKNPDAFLEGLRVARAAGARFRLIICGQRFRTRPPAFAAIKTEFADCILHWGYAPDREAYHALLGRSHIAVSTANHEFFGVAMLEATHFGARPLVPDRLSYPEIFPAVYRYPDDASLGDELTRLCRGWESGRVQLRDDRRTLTQPHTAPCLRAWGEFLAEVQGGPAQPRQSV
jgi:glycosyltransferase involved in cell wall biosynthesis